MAVLDKVGVTVVDALAVDPDADGGDLTLGFERGGGLAAGLPDRLEGDYEADDEHGREQSLPGLFVAGMHRRLRVDGRGHGSC